MLFVFVSLISQIRDTINGGSVGRSDEGEIWVKGPQVTTGYVGGRWQTNRVTDKGWLNTGMESLYSSQYVEIDTDL